MFASFLHKSLMVLFSTIDLSLGFMGKNKKESSFIIFLLKYFIFFYHLTESARTVEGGTRTSSLGRARGLGIIPFMFYPYLFLQYY